MPEKILGYILLVTGIITILLSTFSIYSIFIKRSKPVQIFNFRGISLNTSQLLGGNISPEIQSLLGNNKPEEQKTELISPEVLNDTSNLFAHLLIMGFIASIGFKIASLGTNLVRPIIIKTKNEQPAKRQQKPEIPLTGKPI